MVAAAEVTETLAGTLGAEVKTTGTPIKCNAYTCTKVTQSDWVILGDFTVIKEAVCYTVSTGARTAEAFTIDGTTTNKITLTSAITGTVSIVAFGY